MSDSVPGVTDSDADTELNDAPILDTPASAFDFLLVKSGHGFSKVATVTESRTGGKYSQHPSGHRLRQVLTTRTAASPHRSRPARAS